MTFKILIVVHQETSSPGRVGHMLEGMGCRLDIRRPRFGDPLPETMDDHAAAVIFGGPMSANDGDDFIKQEIDWIGVPLRDKKPFLGICLGAQMLAKHLGGSVAPHPHGHAEIGYYRIRPTDAGRRLTWWPEQVYQWHRDGFTLPRDATLLAEAEIFPEQAFSFGRSAYGLQFHPELTLAMMNRWTVKGAHRLLLPGAKSRAEHFSGRALHDGALRRWLRNFLKFWMQCGCESPQIETGFGGGRLELPIAAIKS